jgi:integrase/recombinase XerD
VAAVAHQPGEAAVPGGDGRGLREGRPRAGRVDDPEEDRRGLHRLRHGAPEQLFHDYNAAHTRGGTNTKQRNLRHLFTWLEAEYDHPHPYTDELSRYAPAAGRPSTLSADFIRDLLALTGGGRGNAFGDVRDHALIRVLTEGLRRTEVTEMRMTDLPLDLVSQRVIGVVPLKGARAEEEGRVALVAPATARAIAAYLRARRCHRLADSPFVWLGLRNRGPLDGMGLYRMLRRRAEQAGWPAAGSFAVMSILRRSHSTSRTQ